jgi:molybdopterin synthase catalytic subunit
MTVRVITHAFVPGTEFNDFFSASNGAGASVTFTGVVGSDLQNPINALTWECYPALVAIN